MSRACCFQRNRALDRLAMPPGSAAFRRWRPSPGRAPLIPCLSSRAKKARRWRCSRALNRLESPGAVERTRTSTPCGANPSSWCVYQFRHDREPERGVSLADETPANKPNAQGRRPQSGHASRSGRPGRRRAMMARVCPLRGPGKSLAQVAHAKVAIIGRSGTRRLARERWASGL
jgi:hypothetical protein